MPDDPVLAPWRRMRRAGLILLFACALLLPFFYFALHHAGLGRRLRDGIPAEVLSGIPKLLWMGLAGGTLSALLASLKLRGRPPTQG
jgi:hypothetical protein